MKSDKWENHSSTKQHQPVGKRRHISKGIIDMVNECVVPFKQHASTPSDDERATWTANGAILARPQSYIEGEDDQRRGEKEKKKKG
jgi:hypothetical protein